MKRTAPKKALILYGLLFAALFAQAQEKGSFLPGLIAYIREGKEIRLVDPAGANDRLLWAHPRPDLVSTSGITGLSWRHDGSGLAFASGHEAVYSIYQSDLFFIKQDGSGLRRLTNPPGRTGLSGLPKGTVKVTVRNAATGAGDDPAMSVFIVYVAGAAEPQSVSIPPGSSQSVTFTGVADLGKSAQPVVALPLAASGNGCAPRFGGGDQPEHHRSRGKGLRGLRTRLAG